MKSKRSILIDWFDQSRIPNDKLHAAFTLAGVLPDKIAWRHFIDRMLLFMGVVMLAAGVIFFFAFNWHGLGNMAKFALVEIPLVATLCFAWRFGVDGIIGKATLLFAALLVGALLALVGQTYQTGADTFELFLAWALAILPWTLLARFPVLWIFWLALLNITVSLYGHTVGFFRDSFPSPEALMWLLFGMNTLALVLWEWLAATVFQWLQERWAVRLIATVSCGLITALATQQVIVHDSDAGYWAAPLWLAWTVAAYFAYRRRIRDVYVLALGMLSAIVMVTVIIVKSMNFDDAGMFLLIGLIVIGMSAAGGYWLKQVASEEEEP